MVVVSVCMECRQRKKGWPDRVNEPYNQFYCTSCWVGFMGYSEAASGKDTVWWREKWKEMSNAPRHSASVEYCRKYWSSRRRQRESQQSWEEHVRAESEEDEDEEEDGGEVKQKWLEVAVRILFEHGGGNMRWATLDSKLRQAGCQVSQTELVSRPEFETCGQGHRSVRLASWKRLSLIKP